MLCEPEKHIGSDQAFEVFAVDEGLWHTAFHGQRQRTGTQKMQERSLDRVVMEVANKRELDARAVANEMNRSLEARKGGSLGRIACKGLLVVTIWLLLASTHGLSQASSTSINLLNPKNGGQVVVETSDGWLKTIDGNESRGMLLHGDDSAVYAFKGERPATFDTFAVLIPGRDEKNVKEFELLTGDSPDGEFSSLGKFTTHNAKFLKNPYQESKFPPVTAKYLKVQLLSNWGYYDPNVILVFQFRFFGRLKD
jgi:hypothetical protein